MSKSGFLALMDSFETVSNVKLESNTIKKYIKGGKAIQYGADGINTFIDSTTKECISWSPQYKSYSIIPYKGNGTGLENYDFKFIRL